MAKKSEKWPEVECARYCVEDIIYTIIKVSKECLEVYTGSHPGAAVIALLIEGGFYPKHEALKLFVEEEVIPEFTKILGKLKETERTRCRKICQNYVDSFK